MLNKLDLAELEQFRLARELSITLIQRWLTHGRGLDMQTLQDELKLKITDYSKNLELKQAVWDYFFFLADHMSRIGQTSFVHSPDFF